MTVSVAVRARPGSPSNDCYFFHVPRTSGGNFQHDRSLNTSFASRLRVVGWLLLQNQGCSTVCINWCSAECEPADGAFEEFGDCANAHAEDNLRRPARSPYGGVTPLQDLALPGPRMMDLHCLQ